MRHTTLFLMLCLNAVVLGANTYVESSVLRSGKIIQLQINESGLYGLSYEQIQSMGLRPDSVRLLGYGGNLINQDFSKPHEDDVPSIPFYMQVGNDGVFSKGDYIIFYANGPVGWTWNSSNSSFTHTRNCYADYGCYFLSDEAGEQKILAMGEAIDSTPGFEAYTYTSLQLHEIDQYNMIDIDGQDGGGREWYGEKLTPANPKLTIPFHFEDVDTTTNLFYRIEVAANSGEATTLKSTVAGKSINSRIEAIPSGDFYTYAVSKTSTTMTHPTSNDLTVDMEYTSPIGSSIAYLNYIELQVPCYMHLRGNYLFIRNTEHVNQTLPTRYHLTGVKEHTQIWNITDPVRAYIVPTTLSHDTLSWIDDNTSVQCFVAVNTDANSWTAPSTRGQVINQDIHALIRGMQHIILTPEEFLPAAQRLQQIHEQHSSTERWAVVTDQQVYNEFSSGTPDASAYRWMMKYLYDTFGETSHAPKSLLLLGDGSFDNRQLLKTSAKPYLLTYQASNSLVETKAYATDDYFGWLDDKGGVIGNSWDDKRARMQIGVGRLPVRSIEEAEAVVSKIERYLDDQTADSWKQQLCFLADDGDHGTHTACSDTAARRTAAVAPDYICNKIYLDSYVQETSASGESYPIAYNTFSNLLQTGVMLMDYAGHGSANNICSEMFLTKAQVEKMNNTNLGVWALATCSFAHFDQTAQSTAELAVLNPNGGAIAVVSSDRTVYASENVIINKYFCENLFKHSDPFTYSYTIGEALRLAKNQNGDNMNKLPYLLLGDPSIMLNHPCQYQACISSIPDTLNALDLVVIHGYISNGDTLQSRRDTANFTGKLTMTVFDKIQTIATRDNDETNPDQKSIMYFQDYPNKLFTGEADVVDGIFSIEFRIPKDIRYNLGNGRITMYAIGEDESGRAEAMGHNEKFVVGGSSPWTIDDNNGPIMQIYLNSPLFNDGDHVNPTPHFYADLQDENGINTIGSGIGHDLQLVIDNSPKQTYILNNYYTADNNSYKSGSISYILPELTDGSHSLSFRAWDLLNNATTQTIGFTVDSHLSPIVQSVLVYPNPVSRYGTINMQITNDRPDDNLNISISFYDLSGRQVWSSTRELYSDIITFDMAEAGLTPGSYIYQFTIQTATQVSSKYNGRLIVY